MKKDCYRKIFKKILYPPKIIGIPLCIFSAILLIYVFSIHLEEHPLAYFAYFLSAYSLVLFMIWFCKACKFSKDFIKDTKVYKWYNKHSHNITKIYLIIVSIINLIYGIFKLITGIYYNSFWFITFAVYYLIICLMTIGLIRNVKHIGKDINKEYRKLKHTGVILLLLNIVLVGMMILIIKKDQYFSYSGVLIYIIALYDFYLIITAIINILKRINYKSPLIMASKCMNLTIAMISMLSLEVAMIYQFGDNDTNLKLIMTFCIGISIALINSVMAIIMIYKGNKRKEMIS